MDNIVRKRKIVVNKIEKDHFNSDDPFHSSDNSDDPDYVEEKSIANPAKKKKSNGMPKKGKAVKSMTPKERIIRLKNKFWNSKDTQTKSKDSQKNDDNRLKANTRINTPEEVKTNFDYMFDSEECVELSKVTSDECAESTPKCQQTKSVIEEDITSKNDFNPSEFSSLLEMNRLFMNQLNELTKEVVFMRKQLARMEAKGTAVGDFNANIEKLMDLDESLAMEGLPLRSVDTITDFEVKLRISPDYRKKLV